MLFRLSIGRFTASQVDATLRHPFTTPRAPVVYCHGTESNATDAAAQANARTVTSGMRRILRAIADQGHVIVIPTAPNLWGSTTGRARITDAITYARGTLGAAGPAILVGYSQGGAAALRFAMTNPTEVAGIVGVLAATDMDYIRDNDIASQRAAIDTAYSVTYPAVLPAGVNPADNPGSFHLPMAFWYSSDDAMVSATATTDFATATGATVHNLGALGHTDTAQLAVNPNDVTAFVRSLT